MPITETENAEGSLSPASSPTSLGRVFALCAVVLIIFALNLFALQPFLMTTIGPRAAQTGYVLVRVLGILGLAFGLAKNAKRNRFQILSTVLLVGFIDQVFLKGIWIKHDMSVHPAAWAGIQPVNSMIFLNMALGYLFFIPLVLILAFFGMEATRFRKDWRARD
jgi:hypothetical protein